MNQEMLDSHNSTESVGRVVRMQEHRCLRCGHVWIGRTTAGILPLTCAGKKCRSPLWNKPRAYRLEGKPAPTRQPSKRKPRKEVAT